MYYDMQQELKDVIPTVFNEKIAFATELAIKHVAYKNNWLRYKFVYSTYTCAAFTVYSFDGNVKIIADDPSSDLFVCDEYKDKVLSIYKY